MFTARTAKWPWTRAQRDTAFGWMTESQAGWDQFFHDWRGGGASGERAADSPQAALYADAAFATVRAGLNARSGEPTAHLYFERPTPASLVIEEIERVWGAIADHDDWAPYEAKLNEIAALREALGVSCHRPVAQIS